MTTMRRCRCGNTLFPWESCSYCELEDALAAVEAAEQDVIEDMGEEALEGAWAEIVRAAIMDYPTEIQTEVLRRNGLVYNYEMEM